MIRAGNTIHAHAPDFVVNDELLLPILRKCSQNTHYTRYTKYLIFFFSVRGSSGMLCRPYQYHSIYPHYRVQSPAPRPTQPPLPSLPFLRGSSRVLWCVLTFWRIVVPSSSGSSTPRTVAALLNQQMLRQADRGKIALCSSRCPVNSYKYHVCLRNAKLGRESSSLPTV